MRDLFESLRAAVRAAVNEYRRQRWLRSGFRNPDECPF